MGWSRAKKEEMVVLVSHGAFRPQRVELLASHAASTPSTHGPGRSRGGRWRLSTAARRTCITTTKKGMDINVAEIAVGDFDAEDGGDDGDSYSLLFAVHTYCSVCGHDWTAGLQQPPSQQGFLECPECRCWSRLNLIDDDLRQ